MWLAMKIISWAGPKDKTPWQAQRDLGDGQTETSRSQTGGSQEIGYKDQGDVAKRLQLALQAAVRCAAR